MDDSEFAAKDKTDMYLYLVDHGFDDSIAKVFKGIFEILLLCNTLTVSCILISIAQDIDGQASLFSSSQLTI